MKENWQYAHLHVQSVFNAYYLSIAPRLNWNKQVHVSQKGGQPKTYNNKLNQQMTPSLVFKWPLDAIFVLMGGECWN